MLANSLTECSGELRTDAGLESDVPAEVTLRVERESPAGGGTGLRDSLAL